MHTLIRNTLKSLLLAVTLMAATVSAQDAVLIKQVAITGDTDFLQHPLSEAVIRSGFEGKSMDQEAVEKQLKHINKLILNQGFYLARVEADYDKIGDGVLGLTIAKGRLGNVNFHRLPGEYRGTEAEQRKASRKAYTGGYFSSDQLRPRFQPGNADAAFNYHELHKEIYSVNSLPDITLNTDLTIREEGDERYMDVDFYVEDKLPVHGVLEFKNTGTKATDEERLTLTLQHLNLSKHNDTLTLELLSSLDFSTLRNASASYNVPYKAGEGGGISFFGGYSELAVDDIVSGIDLAADGWHVGNRNFHHLVDNEKMTFNVAYGLLLSQLSDSLELREGEQVKTDIQTAPASVGFVMHSNRPDQIGGRNFVTLLYTYNLGDAFGVTKDEDVDAIRPGAAAGYSHFQFQASRIQSLGGQIDENSGERVFAHYLFGNVDIQYAGEPLVSSEKKAIGGLETVRGYPENFIAGDNGMLAKLELRTLIFKGGFSRYLGRSKSVEDRKRLTADYVQLTSFLDYGHVEDESVGDLVGEDQSLLGAGVGIRFALTGNSQVKLDYGYPIESIEGISDAGRLHFGIEAQF
jgi:hemolysin activation/secretion protein